MYKESKKRIRMARICYTRSNICIALFQLCWSLPGNRLIRIEFRVQSTKYVNRVKYATRKPLNTIPINHPYTKLFLLPSKLTLHQATEALQSTRVHPHQGIQSSSEPHWTVSHCLLNTRRDGKHTLLCT